MDTGDSRSEPQYSDGDIGHRQVMERSGDLDQRTRDGDGWRLVDVLLSGGAPWGFTLKGGREHREPLLITKVEEGSKAAAVSLQVGDEIVNINEVPLSGYRQEAICLVKGSHKTLTLVVKRNMKMVDIVAQKMPSESDVHVARSFLTKILRSSMRRNEPVSRPHSWHSTKFNESQSQTAKTQSPPTPVWQTRYDASSSSTDLTTGWDQTNLRRVSDQFSSLGSMDSLEHVSHAYPPGCLSPAKSNNSVEHLGGGKRDSAYSSFSTSSGTPDYTLSKSNAASMENMLYKVSQWDSGGRHSNGRHSQSLSEGIKQDERPGYLQLPGGSTGRESPRTDEQPGFRHSSSGRVNFGPVWHVPEKKKTTSPSPPPPPPPVRSDSFAATKVHEKGLITAYPEGPGAHVHPKFHGKGIDKGLEASDNTQCTNEGRLSHNLPPKNDIVNPYIPADNSNHNQLNTNKLYSLSTTDVRLAQPPYAHVPYHQRQYSDESTLYSQPRATSIPKPQNISGYYSSMQELPTNNQLYSQNQGRTPSTSVSSTAIDQNPDSSGQSRYYCVTARQPGQAVSQALLVKADDRKSGTGKEVVQGGSDRTSLSPQMVNKAKYQLPQQQQLYTNSKDSNGYNKQDDGPRHKQPAAVTPPAVLESSIPKASSDERGGQMRNASQNAETHYMSYPPSKQTEQRRSLPLQQRELLQDTRQTQGGSKICPKTTPMLHSLSKETTGLGDKPRDTNCEDGQQEALDPLTIKQVRRSERFATTLRNEIQMRRARLQKSNSAAALSGSCEAEEGPEEVWKSKETSTSASSDGSFTSTYKDHLKEAQARVLKATSFRRRDLEPVLLEHPGAEALPGYPSSILARKDATQLPSVSEALPNKSGSVSSQVTRIGGRKRFSTEKKVRSYSEPDKINEVGVDEDLCPPESAGSLGDRRKFFEATGKPAFPKPIPKQAIQSCSEDSREGKARVMAHTRDSEDALREVRTRATPPTENTEEGQEVPYSVHKQALLEQQRLGTFAEYEATWNIQNRPPETKASGRYRSADNILDPGAEERTKPTCVHERSRSSPSADFYGQNIPVLGRKSSDYSQPEQKDAEQDNTALRGRGECKVKEKPVELEHFPEPPPPLLTGESPESRHIAAPVPEYHRPTSISYNPVDTALPHPEVCPHSGPQSAPRRKVPVPQRPPPPKLDKYRRPEITPPLSDSHESLTGSQGGASTTRSPSRELNPAPVSTHSPKRVSEPSKGFVEKEQGAVHQVATSNSEPAPPPLPPSCGPAALPKPTMDGQRSPSPQFAPQRLTDKPPVSLQDENSKRMEDVMENNNTAVKKVPIKIVHSESVTEKESRQYLLHSDATVGAQGPGVTQLSSLGAPEQSSYSLFCAYTRQGPDRDPNHHPAPQTDPGPQRDTDMGPLRDHSSLTGQQAAQPTEATSSNGVAPGTHAEEDVKREELARDIMGKDKSLADILDQSKMKTTMDLMEGIFPQGEQLLEGAHQRRKVAPKQTSPRASEERNEEDSLATAVALVTSSTYYSTSAPKAELLIKMKDMQEQEQSEEPDSEDELDNDLADKKQELIDSLSRKLQVLREARESVQEDVLDNNALGDEVEATVQQVCKPNELDKFRMFVGDLDKVVSLLLSLSGRLARVENALNSLEEDTSPEERRTLTDKRKLLIRQHEDAKELKENLDRRERVVYDILASYLREESLADYEHFVKMKSALIIEQRKLEDKIKLGDEQLKCLTDSLPLEQRPPL